jgi:hypothetical protein
MVEKKAAEKLAEKQAEKQVRMALTEAEAAGRRRRTGRKECKLRAWRAWAEAVEQGLGYGASEEEDEAEEDEEEFGERGGGEEEAAGGISSDGRWTGIIRSGGNGTRRRGERSKGERSRGERSRGAGKRRRGAGGDAYEEYYKYHDDEADEEGEQCEQRRRLQRHKWGLLWELAAAHDTHRLLLSNFRSWRRSAEGLRLRRRARLFFAARGGVFSPLCWRVFEQALKEEGPAGLSWAGAGALGTGR